MENKFERHLIDNCSPTLASLKTANLFNYRYQSEESLNKNLIIWSRELRKKGISLYMLRKKDNTALIYVCRLKRLERDLDSRGVSDFMYSCGYKSNDPIRAIATLREKLRVCNDFPHEIGLFLGYPLGDVRGFIENKGKNCLICGFWKVYCNECEARKQFSRFTKCRNIYMKLWQEGRSIMQLTVA